MAKNRKETAEKPVLTSQQIAEARAAAKAKFNSSPQQEETKQEPPQPEAVQEAASTEVEANAGFSEEIIQAAAAEADRIAAEEQAQAQKPKDWFDFEDEETQAKAAQIAPQIMLQVAEQVEELAVNQMIESTQKADAAAQAAEQARAEARINAEALKVVQQELAQARAEAQAAKEAARIAAEQAELNKRLAPKILAAERGERIEQARQLSVILKSLEERKATLETILRGADDNIKITIAGGAESAGYRRTEVEFTNKNICKDVAAIFLQKVAEAITIKQNEINTFNI